MPRPDLLLVSRFLPRQVATRTVAEDLAPRLAELGWPVTCTSNRPDRLGWLLDMLRTVHRRRWGAALIEVYSGAAWLWAEAACRLLARRGTPVILTLHGGRLPELARRWPRRVRRLLGRARAVTTPSPYLLEALSPLREDLRLIPNPLDVAVYPFRRRDRPAPRLVWLRAFHRIYRPELAPQVLAALVPKHPDARLAMIGPDKGDGSLQRTRAAAAELGVTDRVRFVGGVPKGDVPVHLDGGDLFLNTTDADNTPVTLLEAMACGLPVVTTNAGGIPHLVADGEDALLAPCGDVEALAAALRRVLGEPGLAARLSATARRKVEAFDYPRVVPLWDTLLQECLQ